MQSVQHIEIKDFDYNLIDDKIAKYPLQKRDASKLLVYKNGNIYENKFNNLSNELPENSLLVFNNTKVIQARLYFRKKTGASIEIFCLEPIDPADYALAFQQKERIRWKCIVGNLKKWKNESLMQSIQIGSETFDLEAVKIESQGNAQIIEFRWQSDYPFAEILEAIGSTPLPPYLNRKAEIADKTRYQTVYSKFDGSVAAPTAGLHFTDNVLHSFKKKGINTQEITLHVGAGTFKPVKSDEIGKHEMHSEHFIITKEALINIQQNITNIIAVGTTSVRTLESLYWLAVKINNKHENLFHINQWEAYELKTILSSYESIEILINYCTKNDLDQIEASTQIIIAPSYSFKIVKAIITNFHQPKSTLLLLVSALIGDDWKKVYDYALQNNFRFLSYGDSSLLFPGLRSS